MNDKIVHFCVCCHTILDAEAWLGHTHPQKDLDRALILDSWKVNPVFTTTEDALPALLVAIMDVYRSALADGFAQIRELRAENEEILEELAQCVIEGIAGDFEDPIERGWVGTEVPES